MIYLPEMENVIATERASASEACGKTRPDTNRTNRGWLRYGRQASRCVWATPKHDLGAVEPRHACWSLRQGNQTHSFIAASSVSRATKNPRIRQREERRSVWSQ